MHFFQTNEKSEDQMYGSLLVFTLLSRQREPDVDLFSLEDLLWNNHSGPSKMAVVRESSLKGE